MSADQAKAQLDEAIQKFGDRLVELGFAQRFVWDTKRKVGRFVWTDEGIALRDAVRKIYDVREVHPKHFTFPELIALAAVLLSSEEIENQSK